MADRIASLIAAGTEMVGALGLADRLVGVSHECDWPIGVADLPHLTSTAVDAHAEGGVIHSAVRDVTAADQPLYHLDVAGLAAARPDLIVTQSKCDVCAVAYDDVLAAVRDVDALGGVQVVDLDPGSLDDVLADIGRLGRAAGLADDATSGVVAGLRERIDAVTAATASLAEDDRPVTASIEWMDPVMIAGNWDPGMVLAAGGRLAVPAQGTSQFVEWEAVVEARPEVIVVACCGYDLGKTLAEAGDLTSRPGWTDLPAVRDGRVWAVDGNAYFNRPGPRLVDSLEILAHLLHPRLFPSDPAPGCWTSLA